MSTYLWQGTIDRKEYRVDEDGDIYRNDGFITWNSTYVGKVDTSTQARDMEKAVKRAIGAD